MQQRRCLVLTAILLLLLAGLLPVTGTTASAADAPQHSVAVVGDGAVTFPAFSPSVERYAVRPGAAASGSLTVRASTTDPTGTVRVNGSTVVGGSRVVHGLEVGDEISVLVDDAGGTAAYAFVVLPTSFPLLERTTPATDATQDGLVLLTLGKWIEAGPFFEAAVDENGVPAHVLQTPNSMDLQKQPNGNYSVARGGADGADIVELDAQFREVRRLRTQGLAHTDGHDAILEPDGSAYLMSYEPDSATGWTDAVIQHLSPTGEVLFEWNSADHVDIAAETVINAGNRDYAHINSFEVMDDGDLLVSFRHLSSVFKIAREAHDGFDQGDVVWRLGGRRSDFTFVDADGAPDEGPCAQHTATQLADGHVMVFDNRAWEYDPLCVDPADPSAPPVARKPSRIVEWALDETTMEAREVKDLRVGDRYAIFAGSAQRLDNGNTMVGWAAETRAVASELSPTGDVLWELRAPENPKYFTYRALKADVPDAIAPEVTFDVDPGTSTVTVGATEVPDLGCTDRGGSSLRSCTVAGLDTSTPGTRTLTATARDGAGNETTVRRTYTVVAAPPPATTPPAAPTPAPTPTTPTPTGVTHLADLHLKAVGHPWRGRDVHDVRRGQTVHTSSALRRSVFRVRVQNDGTTTERFNVRLRTRADVAAPRWASRERRTTRLEPGESTTFRLVVRREVRRRRAAVTVVARSAADPGSRDRVWARTVWR